MMRVRVQKMMMMMMPTLIWMTTTTVHRLRPWMNSTVRPFERNHPLFFFLKV
jgi:hypothetical protein